MEEDLNYDGEEVVAIITYPVMSFNFVAISCHMLPYDSIRCQTIWGPYQTIGLLQLFVHSSSIVHPLFVHYSSTIDPINNSGNLTIGHVFLVFRKHAFMMTPV